MIKSANKNVKKCMVKPHVNVIFSVNIKKMNALQMETGSQIDKKKLANIQESGVAVQVTFH